MNFKALVENIIDSKDIYTIDELKSYRIWETNIKNLPTIKKQIKEDGLYAAGVRVLVPIFDAPDNEITNKTKELVNINGENVIKAIKELRAWAQDNITPERKKELGIKEDDSYIVNSTKPGLGLAVSKALVEAYSKGVLVVPVSTFKEHRLTSYVYDTMGQKLHIIIHSLEYKDFKKISGWRNINAYKEFYQFDDKETEEDWGDVISGL